ncbi:MAG: response regulator [Elusimicrobia bacterium]|nr:response regulator [Candidatus Liberimonas magnetica]
MMKKRSKELLKISEVSKLAGVLPSTVRYYTDIGLILVASETQGGHRLYDKESTLTAISKIQFLNKKGMTMEDIKKDMLSSKIRKKILVIDDEPEFGDLVNELINHQFPDYEVKIVYNGFSAGRMLNEYLPDLIILDLMLPGVNGFEVCQQIRSSEFLNSTRILAITGYDSEENRKKILDCGANDYLAKPMDVQTLKEKITSMLEKAS